MKNKGVLAIALLLLTMTPAKAAELKQGTVQAWDTYVRIVNSNMAERATGRRLFLWVDESPELRRRVLGGEVVVAAHDLRRVPHGLIHHWIGAMFLPGATLDSVMRVLDDYDDYQSIYHPLVARSKLVERTDDYEKATLLMTQKAFSVTGAVETDNEVKITKLDASRVYSTSTAVRVQEIANYGRRDEQLLPEGRGPGYVWRTTGITRIEERDAGVYVEMEITSLSRGIPVAFSWLITPLTEKLPRKIMFEILNDTRIAVSRQTVLPSDANQAITQKGAPRKIALR